MRRPLVLGLTGKSCAGKDLASAVLASRGWTIIDLDREGHLALDGNPEAIIGAFGPEVEGAGGRVDRKALGRVVFSDPRALARLEEIVHPEMIASVELQIRRAAEGDAPARVVINGALVERMGLTRLCDALLVITAPLPLRLLRAIRRDRISPVSALKRFASQRDIGAKRNEKDVDTYYICNPSGAAALEHKVTGFAEELERRISRQE